MTSGNAERKIKPIFHESLLVDTKMCAINFHKALLLHHTSGADIIYVTCQGTNQALQ